MRIFAYRTLASTSIIKMLPAVPIDRAIRECSLAEVDAPGMAVAGRLGGDQLGHRVAVLRAKQKVLGAEPDRRYRHAILSRGNMRVFFNAASVASTAKGDFKTWHLDGDGWGRTRDSEPQRLAEAERAVAEHTIMRHGTDERRRQLAERSAAEHQLSMASCG
jgi:hypothetical protein